jgi:large subunit ribosomal protein L25
VAEVKLKAIKREATGKGSARRSRSGGKVPAIVYGHGMDPVSIEVDRREFVTALQTDAGMNVLLSLDIDGDSTLALTKELQRDPVRGTLLHADFIQVSRTEKVEVEVPVHLVGLAPGVVEGGVLEQQLNNLHVRSLATEVPQSIDADISGLAIGDSLRVSDLDLSSSYEVLNDLESLVASIAQPVTEAELEEMEASAGVVQEEPDAAEGEAPAEGEDAPAPESPAEGDDS